MFKLFNILHLLSFDVVLGAVVCNIMFWKLNQIPPEHSILIVFVLGFSVWIVYVLDRLLDIQKKDVHLTERHIFHQEHAKILWYFIGFLTLTSTVLVFFLPSNLILFGIIISLFTGIYLIVISRISTQNNFQFIKEPITSFVYVSGVFGTTILHNPAFSSVLIGVLFLLIVFQNLLLFSLMEFKKTKNSYNLVANLGIKISNFFIILITLINAVGGFFLIYYSTSAYETSVVLIEIVMTLILLIINQFDHFFMINDRYRWVGDGIFLLPLLIIL